MFRKNGPLILVHVIATLVHPCTAYAAGAGMRRSGDAQNYSPRRARRTRSFYVGKLPAQANHRQGDAT
jgi:hypothetical protein